MNWPYCLAQGRAIREANITYKVLYNEAQSYSNINTSKLSNASPLPRMHDSGPTGLIIAVQACGEARPLSIFQSRSVSTKVAG